MREQDYRTDAHANQPTPTTRERSWDVGAIVAGIAILFAGSLFGPILLALSGAYLLLVLSFVNVKLPLESLGGAALAALLAAEIALGLFAGWIVAGASPAKWRVNSLAAAVLVVLFTSSALPSELLLVASTFVGAAVHARRHARPGPALPTASPDSSSALPGDRDATSWP